MSVVTDTLRETGSSLSTVFRNPALRRLNLGFAGSAIGDWAYATAIVVWAYGVGGVTAVGIWGTVRLVLMTIATPIAATFVDRFDRKKIMITTDLARCVVVTGCAVLIWKDAPVIAVFVLASLSSILATPFRPAVAALLPKLVTKPEELTAANGTSSTIDSLSFFVGPAIGGMLLTVASVPVVIIFNALTFLWSAALVAGIRVPAAAPATVAAPGAGGATGDETSGHDDESVAEVVEEAEAGFVREASEGFRTIWRHPDLRLISLVYCAQTIVAGASIVFGIEIATQMTPFGSTGVGYLDSSFGIGAIIGGLVALGRASARRLATDFGIGVIFWALPLLLAAAFPQLWAAFLAMFIIGFANPIVDVNAATILQRLTDDKVMGRVFGALETGLIAAMALGSVIMPLLLHWIGLRWALTVLALGITAIVLPAMARLRAMDAELGEPEGLALLRLVPLFAPLDPKSLELVANQMQRIEVAAGDVVIREGDPGDRFYIVESGALTASFQDRVLSHQGPGDPFGEIALLMDVPRTATVVADEPSVLFTLERDTFLDAVTGNSEVRSQADDLIARRIPTY